MEPHDSIIDEAELIILTELMRVKTENELALQNEQRHHLGRKVLDILTKWWELQMEVMTGVYLPAHMHQYLPPSNDSPSDGVH